MLGGNSALSSTGHLADKMQYLEPSVTGTNLLHSPPQERPCYSTGNRKTGIRAIPGRRIATRPACVTLCRHTHARPDHPKLLSDLTRYLYTAARWQEQKRGPLFAATRTLVVLAVQRAASCLTVIRRPTAVKMVSGIASVRL